MKILRVAHRSIAKHWQLNGWTFWLLAALFYAYEFLHRVAPGVLTGNLREGFGVDDRTLGTIAAMYFYAYAAFQVPAGILVDKLGVKRILIFASSIVTIGSFIFALTNSSFNAHLSRFMIGMGSAFAFVCCLKIAAQWLEHQYLPVMVGLTNLSGTFGALLGGIPLSYLAASEGWRKALIEISVVGLVLTLLIIIFLRDKKMAIETQHRLGSSLWQVITARNAWLTALYAALLVGPIAAIPEMWGVPFLEVAYQFSTAKASSVTHTIFIGTAIGGPLIGWLSKRGCSLQLMRNATIGALLLLSLFIYVKLPLELLYPLLLIYGLLTANMLLTFTLLIERQPIWAQGAAIGFLNMIIMLGAGISQYVVGRILTYLHARHGDYSLLDFRIALSILPIYLLIAIVVIGYLRPNKRA